jgi:hypothetical protein
MAGVAEIVNGVFDHLQIVRMLGPAIASPSRG